MNLITETQAVEALADMRADLAEMQAQLAAAEPAVAATVADLHTRLTALDARLVNGEDWVSIEVEYDETVQALAKTESAPVIARSDAAKGYIAHLAQLQAGLARWRHFMASDSAGPLPVESEITQMRTQFVLFARGSHAPPSQYKEGV